MTGSRSPPSARAARSSRPAADGVVRAKLGYLPSWPAPPSITPAAPPTPRLPQPQHSACARRGRFAAAPASAQHPDGQIAGENQAPRQLATASPGRSPSQAAAASTAQARNPGDRAISSSGAGSSRTRLIRASHQGLHGGRAACCHPDRQGETAGSHRGGADRRRKPFFKLDDRPPAHPPSAHCHAGQAEPLMIPGPYPRFRERPADDEAAIPGRPPHAEFQAIVQRTAAQAQVVASDRSGWCWRSPGQRHGGDGSPESSRLPQHGRTSALRVTNGKFGRSACEVPAPTG